MSTMTELLCARVGDKEAHGRSLGVTASLSSVDKDFLHAREVWIEERSSESSRVVLGRCRKQL